MDKVQVYYTVLLSLHVVIRCALAVYRPDEVSDRNTNKTKFNVLPISLLLALPVVGRIYGWW